VYAYFLGGIDGLPPLPQDYWPCVVEGDPDKPPKPPLPQNKAKEKLRLAFGEAWEELKRTMKLAVRNKGLVLATGEANIKSEGDRKGQVELKLFSIAIFGKTAPGGTVPEINTIRSDIAYLTFDKPINNIHEMGSRRIVGAELGGDVKLINNRRTLNR